MTKRRFDIRCRAALAAALLPWPMQAVFAATDPCRAAADYLEQAAAANNVRTTVQCKLGGADRFRLVQGSWLVTVSAGSLISGTVLVALMPSADALPQRRLVVPMGVEIQSPAWLVNRALRRGEMVTAADVVRAGYAWPVGVQPLPAGDEAPVGRVRKALRMGEAIAAGDLLNPGVVPSGELVSAVLRADGLAVQVPAVLLAEARIGERVRVQLKDRRVVLEGRLTDASSVDIES